MANTDAHGRPIGGGATANSSSQDPPQTQRPKPPTPKEILLGKKK